MTNKNSKNSKNSKTVVQAQKSTEYNESELLIAYQRELDRQVLEANIEAVNACVSSQARFVQAINLLVQQNSDFSIKALSYKSKQRNLLYKNNKILYFTDNFVNVTKTQANKYELEIMSVKKYNHAYCYNVAVECYKTYSEIKELVTKLA